MKTHLNSTIFVTLINQQSYYLDQCSTSQCMRTFKLNIDINSCVSNSIFEQLLSDWIKTSETRKNSLSDIST